MKDNAIQMVEFLKASGKKASDMTQGLKKMGEGEIQAGMERIADQVLKTGAQMGERIGLAKGKRDGLLKGAAIGVASGVIGGVALTALTLLALNGAKKDRQNQVSPWKGQADESLEDRMAQAILSEEDLPTSVDGSEETAAPAVPEAKTETEEEA